MGRAFFFATIIAFGYHGIARAADAAAGKVYFTEMCALCHSAEPTDGGGGQGPTLFRLLGRAAAAGDAMFPYTAAMRESKLVWDAQTLELFLADPAKLVPGTAMPLPVPAKKDRDNLIAYFQSLMDRTK